MKPWLHCVQAILKQRYTSGQAIQKNLYPELTVTGISGP